MGRKVGIVIVCYNAATAVRITLASLCQAKIATAVKVMVIDNASNDLEREKIRFAFDKHVAKDMGLPWEFLALDKNIGFSGGNNVGIRRFMEDPEISHICLLNSDVIVTDSWLDYLLAYRCDIISAVTNRADSEQCVPIDYALDFDLCLDTQTESIQKESLALVQNFAQDWHQAWKGNLVEVDVTFFCVLLTKSVVEKVGLLDEAFFPGGFEDDDYCLRASQLGFRIHLARDTYIHHWGSASFGKLSYQYFKGMAQSNRSYLEKKHGIVWQIRPEKPFVSYLMALRFACSQQSYNAKQQRFNALYGSQLGASLGHFESEFKKLLQMLVKSRYEVEPLLQEQLDLVADFGDLTASWLKIVAGAALFFADPLLHQALAEELCVLLESLAGNLHTLVECNFAIHDLLLREGELPVLASPLPSSMSDAGKLKKLLWLLKKGGAFLLKLRGIVFFGGYPYPERQSDGYFQRIQIIDNLFSEHWRVYVESDELPGRNRWFELPQPKVLVLRILGGRRRRALVRALAAVVVLKCRKVYFHSVLRMHDNRFGYIMHLPFVTKAIDIHGVVPEEFRFHNDFYSALLYEREERLAVRKSDLVIVVTESMQNYLRQKYRGELQGKTAIYPMFPSIAPTLAPRPYISGKPVIVYAGGLHKWQQVPKMVDAINRTASICTYRFYCPEPDTVRAMLAEAIVAQVDVGHKTHEELVGLYAGCHYGFILREDIVVNHVACPTKLVEYLAMGIVPVVDFENMGDFKAMGMQSLALDKLLSGDLPTEERRMAMAKQNFAIYEQLRKVQGQGAKDIYALFFGEEPKSTLSAMLANIKNVSSNNHLADAEVLTKVIALISPECDILIQVDNFEAGGLENVVIGLSQTLITSGYKVALLVLGSAGISVQQAEKQGIKVIVGSKDGKLYRELIKCLRPRLLLTHYSLYGAELCNELNIPFVQVIHNTYMWFNAAQRAEFSNAARFTTIFVAVSEYAKRYSVRRLGIDKDHCIVIPNGIDGHAFDIIDKNAARQEIRAKHGLDERDFVFVDVGAINHQKNHLAAVRAFLLVADELPAAKLVIVGPVYEKQLLEQIKQVVKERSLGERVIYAGAAQGAHKYYAMADAFISTAFFEGGPLNQMEAIRANLPCIMADIGFANYFKGRPGFEIIPPALDIAEFDGAIWQLASTTEFEKRIAAAMARVYRNPQCPDLPQDVLDAFDKANAYQCYVGLVGDLLQGKDVRGKKFPDSWPARLTAATPC